MKVPGTNAQKLFKNNEDLTELRVAYTTDGVNFSSSSLPNDGVISGAGSEGGSTYDDISNPAQTVSPSSLNAYGTAGTALATEMRFIGSAGPSSRIRTAALGCSCRAPGQATGTAMRSTRSSTPARATANTGLCPST